MKKFNGWRDIDSFEHWEAQSATSDRDALANFNRREIALTHSQAMARRMLTGLAVLLMLAAVAFLKFWPK